VGSSVGVATTVGGTGVAVGGGGDGVVVWLVQADSNNTSKTKSTNLYVLVVLAFPEPLVLIFFLLSQLPTIGEKHPPSSMSNCFSRRMP
jgi:F0F1-type ATP synthase membrane subunit c/vacuolar-type H+-ATPase subunit K